MKYIFLLVLAAQAAFADLTIRHTIEVKFGDFLPPSAVEPIKAQLAEQLPKGSLVQIKGKKVLTTMGRIVVLADYGKGTITLMDPKAMHFATSSVSEYADRVAAVQKKKMPAGASQSQMFDNMKIEVKSDLTGKTAEIRGLHAEENLMSFALEIPNPSGAAMTLRMEMRQWFPTAEEVKRLPALKEYEAYASMPREGTDPVEMMTKMMSNFPGLADKLGRSMVDLTKNSGKITLRMEAGLFLPSMAATLGGAAGGGPMTQFVMELKELSTAPLADAVFEVPSNYQAAPVEELIEALLPSPKVTLPPTGSYRVGSGVSAPAVLERSQPSYTEEARAAKIQGTVLLGLVVGADGVPREMKVLRSLDPGLDQKAIETVAKWKFKPGMKDGKAVPVQAQIEVSFRLM